MFPSFEGLYVKLPNKSMTTPIFQLGCSPLQLFTEGRHTDCSTQYLNKINYLDSFQKNVLVFVESETSYALELNIYMKYFTSCN
jgi:hypothetical protein